MELTTRIEIKPYTIGELCLIYAVTNKTMNRWLKPHAATVGKRNGRYYTALQVKTIFDLLGLPAIVEEVN